MYSEAIQPKLRGYCELGDCFIFWSTATCWTETDPKRLCRKCHSLVATKWKLERLLMKLQKPDSEVDRSFSRSFIKRDRWRVSPFVLGFLGLRPPLFHPITETTCRAVSHRSSFHPPSFSCSCSIASGCCNNHSAANLRFETKLFKRQKGEQTVSNILLRGKVEVVIQQINLVQAQDLIKCGGTIQSHQH